MTMFNLTASDASDTNERPEPFWAGACSPWRQSSSKTSPKSIPVASKPSITPTSKSRTRNSSCSSARRAAANPPRCAWWRAWRRSPAATSLIDGRRVNDVPPKDRDIAMVFQNYALYPHMTVYKNMAFGLMLRKYPKAEIDAARPRSRPDPRHHRRTTPAQTQGAFRRPTPARRRRPRHRPQAESVPLRRAALEPRRQDARPDARRNHQAARPAASPP